jgi:hypothetical protein
MGRTEMAELPKHTALWGEELAEDTAVFPLDKHVVSVEVLPDPEPGWRTGDVVLRDPEDADCRNTATYIGGGKWRVVYPWETRTFDLDTKRVLSAPHLVLVRDGAPVKAS